jgi:apolipoprotein N-acyltransferase
MIAEHPRRGGREIAVTPEDTQAFQRKCDMTTHQSDSALQMRTRMGRIGIAALSAPLLALAQSPHSLGALALVALVPWLLATERAGTWEAAITGALVGWAHGCLSAMWIPDALESLGSAGWPSVAGFVLTAAWAKLPLFAGAGWIVQRLQHRPACARIAAVALTFAVGESFISRWSLGVPVALVGHSQHSVPGVAQLAVVAGVPLLSAWVVALNQAIALGVSGIQRTRRVAAALAGAWIGTALLGLPLAEATRPAASDAAGVRVLIVQPVLRHRDRWIPELQLSNLDRVARYTDRALTADGGGVQAVVWPENLLTERLDLNPALAAALQGWVDEWQVPVITGLVRSPREPARRRYRSSVVWIEPGRGIAHAVDKARAIPVLESSRPLPGAKYLAALFGRSARWPKVEEVAASGPLRGSFTITPVLCYEVLFPQLVQQRRSPESLAIFNLADDSWVAGETATRQLADTATFRAIEQRLPLIRLAYGGLTRVIDEYGRTQLELPLDEWASADVAIARHAPPTYVERASLLALPIGLGCGVWWMLAPRARRHDRAAARRQ